jgi:hypothetical protein
MLFGEHGRYSYSFADNIKVNHDNMEESGKPCIKVRGKLQYPTNIVINLVVPKHVGGKFTD